MSNMSYCRFENTESDLRDCVEAMEEAATFAELDLSQYELDSYMSMKRLCERFLKQYNVLSETMHSELDDEDCLFCEDDSSSDSMS